MGANHQEFGQRYIGSKVIWTKTGNNPNQMRLISCDESVKPPLVGNDYEKKLLNNIPNPLEGRIFRRVLAERDILPEGDSRSAIIIQPNGNGITYAIQCFINRANRPRALVKRDMLHALNEICAHDAIFTDIACQLDEDKNLWEIYLEEKHKGLIALSKSGSGLKTVITVLAYLFLLPAIENKPLSQYVFGFEELENNIHPALLRRLNDYIYRSSKKNDFICFMTTHSNVLIDQFSRQEDAQIIHVTQLAGKSECNTAKTYINNNGILDDLDVRASDLLQANGIIWVEGPSDRVYLNKWIEVWSDGQLKEGTHYQIIFYGGRLLSHLSAESPEAEESGVSILNANRNAIIMIDSDKKTQSDKLGDTKKRIILEFEKIEALCWITEGREIENYIPAIVVDKFLGISNLIQVEQYDSLFEHMDKLKANEGSKYEAKKPLFAEKIIPLMNKENLLPILDLGEKMNEVCFQIKSWNS